MSSSSTTETTTLNVFEESLIIPDQISGGSWIATGLWHITQYRSSTKWNAFNYGHNDIGRVGDAGSHRPDYSTGVATAGVLTSPVINGIGAAAQVLLRFRHFGDMEAGVIKDLPSVVVRANPGGGALATYDKASLGLSATGNTGGVYLTVTKNITGAVVGAGNFQIEFNFDSVDANLNNTEGWYIDDIEVQVT